MIYPDLHALHWLPLPERGDFPCTPSVYFAIDGTGVVQYIGMSKNPRQRWNSHHRYEELKALPGVRVAFLPVEDVSRLLQIESDLIARFKPLLNGQSGDGTKTGDRIYIARPGEADMDALTVEAWLSGGTIAGEVRNLLSVTLEEQKDRRDRLVAEAARKRSITPEQMREQILCGSARPMSSEQYARSKQGDLNQIYEPPHEQH